MRFPFKKASKQPELRDQMTSMSDFHLLFRLQEIPLVNSGYNFESHEIMRTRGQPNSDFFATYSSTLQMEKTLLTPWDKTSTLSIEYGLLGKDSADSPAATKTVSSLVIRFDEALNEKKIADGSIKARILKYIVDGVEQDLNKTIDLSPLVEYEREISNGFVPVAKSRQPQGHVPRYKTLKTPAP